MRHWRLITLLCGPCAASLACASVAPPGHAGGGREASQPSITATAGVEATARPAAAAVGIHSRSQNLLFSGGAAGSVTNAEVRNCGANGGMWVIQLSNLSLTGSTASLSLTVQPYAGPATYRPQGSLMLIVNQRTSFYRVSTGSVTISDPKKGSMDITFTSAGDSVRVAGRWMC